MTEDKGEDLKLKEEQDGSVMVGGDDAPAPETEEPLDDEDHSDKAGALASDEDHDDEPPKDNESDDDAEERRERNRQRRAENKQRRKDYIDSLKREIAARDEILQDAMRRLEVVERRSQGADMAMVDAEMQKTVDAYSYYKEAHADAVSRADGRAATEANEKMLAAMQRAQQLKAIKESAQRPQQTPQPLDPRLKVQAEEWMSRNNWYDPNGGDPDSEIALTLDRQLAKEGWNPTTPQYWEELDSRVRKYLPHRANSGYNKSQGSSESRPRVPVAGSGRETTAKSTGYRLSSDRVQAIKDAGMWDDPVQRAKMIKTYQEFDKQQGAR